MKSYTVHLPPENQKSAPETPPFERAVFIADGFYPVAALAPPLWLLWRGQWLGLGLYIAFMIALGAAGFWLANWVLIVAYIASAIGFGLEAGSLRRWRLAAKGWRHVDAFTAFDLEDAEEKFFSQIKSEQNTTHTEPPQNQYKPKSTPLASSGAQEAHIIGFS